MIDTHLNRHMKILDSMKTIDNDILNDVQSLKKMPYKVPDGYFESLRHEIKSNKENSGIDKIWQKSIIPATIAAAVAIIVIFSQSRPEDNKKEIEFTEEDYIVFSDYMTNTIYEEEVDIYAEAHTMNEDDIIEYLINYNIAIEEIIGTE